MSSRRWHRYISAQDTAHAAAQWIARVAADAVALRGIFRICLAGGTTPCATYRLLADQNLNWARWRIYYGDERCLPPQHPERNSDMVCKAWLDHVDVPTANHHPIPAEQGPEKGAHAYARHFPAAFPFDLVLLGMGEDGHTASLFPGHLHNPQESVHAVYHASKPPPERVSLSRAALSQTHTLLVLVTGTSKHPALQAWRDGRPLPIAGLTPLAGVDVLVDDAAWRG